MMKFERICFYVFTLSVLSAGCSREELPADKIRYSDASDLMLNTDVAALSERLQMADAPVTARLRTRASGISSVPEIPEGAVRVQDAPSNYNEGVTLESGKNYVLRAGETYKGSFSGGGIQNVSLYVEGTLEVTKWWITGTGINVYILPGGSMTYRSDEWNDVANLKEGHSVYCWGNFATPHNIALKVLKGASLEMYATDGEYMADGLVVEGNFLSGRTALIEKGTLVNGGKAVFEGTANFSVAVEVKQNGELLLGECATVSGDVFLTDNGMLSVRSYLKAGNLDVKGELLMGASSLLEITGNMYVSAWASKVKGETGDWSVIFPGQLFLDNVQELSSVFSGRLDIHAGEVRKGNRWWDGGPTVIKSAGNVLVDGNTSIAPGECRPGFNFSNARLEEVARLSAPHSGYSATSVAFNGNLAYVSWHTNPVHANKDFGGVLDVVDITGRKVLQSLENARVKYNHSMFAGGTLYTMGASNEKGAVCSKISLSNRMFPARSENTEQIIDLEGASGNCVEIIGSTLMAASSGNGGGFSLVFPEKGEGVLFQPASDAKYIYAGDKWLVTLSQDGRGTVKVYDAARIRQGLTPDLARSIETRSLVPDRGKNVVICDDENVYVCMGDNGLGAYSLTTGEEIAHYDVEQVNGVDIDGKYLYLANGFGVTVLNKADLSYVSSFTDADASANYVRKGEDGFIYVAYGTSGLRIFTLTD